MTKRLLSLSIILNGIALLLIIHYVQRVQVAHLPQKHTRVYVDMTSDILHYGHMEFFKKARRLGDYLIVGVCSEPDAKRRKNTPILTTEERVKMLEACRYVDEVIPDAPFTLTAEWLEKHGIDYVAHADTVSTTQLQKWYSVPYKQGLLKIVRRTPGITTKAFMKRIQLAKND